jgi:hypothetical protein
MEQKFRQVTSIELVNDGDIFFNGLLMTIRIGKQKEVVNTLKQLPKSDVEDKTYKDILSLAEINGEYIVYDDFHYLLSANDGIIVLYERI